MVKVKSTLFSHARGVLSARNVHRVPLERRWSEDSISWVRWAPWHTYKDDVIVDGDLPEEIPEDERTSAPVTSSPSNVPQTVYVETRSRVPKEFTITRQDTVDHGRTAGCPGCNSLWRNRGLQRHTTQCRERFRRLLSETAKVKHQTQRKREFEEREESKRKEKQRRKEEKEDSKEQRDINREVRREEREEKRKRSESHQPGRDDEEVKEHIVPEGIMHPRFDVPPPEPSGQPRSKRDLEEDKELDELQIEVNVAELSTVELNDIHQEIEVWVQEVIDEQVVDEIPMMAWDDVHDEELPIEEVRQHVKKKLSIWSNEVFGS